MTEEFVCNLTGERGRPVRCHILPTGLTVKGHGLMLYDMPSDRPARRRPGGWYDANLVTAKGESIFAEFDNAAISAFRQHRLMFSVRRDLGGDIAGADYTHPVGPFEGFFTIPIESCLSIKLFGLSLLWRAAESKRAEFDLVKIPQEAREELKAFILGHRKPRYWEFPMILGAFNNEYEFADLTPFPVTMLGQRFIRWCLDGVIIYVGTRRRSSGGSRWGGIAAGFHADKLCGPILKYKGNRQERTVVGLREEHLDKFGVPPSLRNIRPAYPEFEFDESGNRVRRAVG